MTKVKTVDELWVEVSETVLNNVKVYVLSRYVGDVLRFFSPKIDYVIRKYAGYLPPYVMTSEIDDLRTIAQLEFLESLKAWDPIRSMDVWPLAQARIIGAMKDHIRYITKSDPSRFYDWVTDAAHVYMIANDRADVESQVETGVQLAQAMQILSYRERKVVIAHTKKDLTFKEIGEKLGVSESQISRIYKKSIEKMKKDFQKKKTSKDD